MVQKDDLMLTNDVYKERLLVPNLHCSFDFALV